MQVEASNDFVRYKRVLYYSDEESIASHVSPTCQWRTYPYQVIALRITCRSSIGFVIEAELPFRMSKKALGRSQSILVQIEPPTMPKRALVCYCVDVDACAGWCC